LAVCGLVVSGELDAETKTDITCAFTAAGIEVCRDGNASATVIAHGGADCDASIVEQLRDRWNGRLLVVVPLTVAASPAFVWDLFERGANEVVCWRGANSAQEVKARLDRWAAIDALAETPAVRDRLIGQSEIWRSVVRQVVEIARFSQANVLITGESGTGKELVARALHDLDARVDKGAFVVVDCSSIVESLSGSEFWGHERGAFTGAIAEREGAFALADGGTLFLDEVGELPMELQAELLRVVQEGSYKRVGSNVWRRSQFRLVCATNRNLRLDESEGRFRRDFYFRIAASRLHLPPLEERRDDVLPLFRSFLCSVMAQEVGIEPVVEEFLSSRTYPGNVRDLRQLTVRMANRHVGPGPVTAGDIPDDERPIRPAPSTTWTSLVETACEQALARGHTLGEIREATTEASVQAALRKSCGQVKEAARFLGISDRALHLRRAKTRERHLAR
jgi:transcriptional regulator with GAF, ATPase, and Fis domain